MNKFDGKILEEIKNDLVMQWGSGKRIPLPVCVRAAEIKKNSYLENGQISKSGYVKVSKYLEKVMQDYDRMIGKMNL